MHHFLIGNVRPLTAPLAFASPLRPIFIILIVNLYSARTQNALWYIRQLVTAKNESRNVVMILVLSGASGCVAHGRDSEGGTGVWIGYNPLFISPIFVWWPVL